ncbi:unannotated protein [freshwater metagenome]|uniref:Unannotated protein n=1 Tax=freshwater metagenome TaxID=449393 RepID=A0A6J7RP77_9ZZZZ
MRASVLREDRNTVALIDERTLLGDEVHSVEHCIDQQHVVLAVAGHRLFEIVAQLELDRHPVGRTVAQVDDCDERLDLLEVLGVLGNVGPRRHQLSYERNVLAELRVLVEEEVEGCEAAQNILRKVGAVNSQDQVLAAAALQLGLQLQRSRRVADLFRRGSVDRQRVCADPYLAPAVVNDASLKIDLKVEQVAAALDEVAAICLSVETDDVVGQQARVELIADLGWQHTPCVRLWPWDVNEVVEEHVRARGADNPRKRVEVVVMDHHDRVRLAFDLLDHCLREVVVDDLVAELKGVDLPLPNVRRVRDVPEVVLDEPQHRVGEDVVEAVECLGFAGHQSDLVLAAEWRLDAERMAVGLSSSLDVAVRHRARDPDCLAVRDEACQRRDQTATAASDLAVIAECHRPAV